MDPQDGWFVDRSPGRGHFIFTEDLTSGGGAGGGQADEENTDGTRSYVGGLVGLGSGYVAP